MVIPVAVKMEGTLLLESNISSSIDLSKDYFFLYQIEKEIINGEIKLTVGSPADTSVSEITEGIKKENKKKLLWSCFLKRISKKHDSMETELIIYLEKNN